MKTKALTGAEAAAEAMRQIEPDVVPMYPITPQTQIVEVYSQFVADGLVDSEAVRCESEHSVMSVAIGASTAGARVMTATSAQGLAYMFEPLFIVPALRLPIVMNLVNRALSGPINIHCDHSDGMAVRDSGWITFYCEDAQEVYEHNLMALRIAEHPDVQLPVMVCQDGFITSHSLVNVDILDDKIVKDFIGKRKPAFDFLDTKNPISVGALDFYDYFFEHKKQEFDAMEASREVIKEIYEEFSKISGKDYDFIEKYQTEDAEHIIVAMSSACGMLKNAVDELRKKGKKVGLLKIVLFRPFPESEIAQALNNAKSVIILERMSGFGAYSPLYNEISAALFHYPKKPKMVNYVFGLGGRNFGMSDALALYSELEKIDGEFLDEHNKLRYWGVRE
ncbi:TPA: pyruvate ferredoxin oxidoreductase [Candidatus Woesearchaeota archaeon]|nr:pyruvate ferredoxin oxidoreductase [Candidatus Woesearchaeota archaeon]HIH32040.1 pyruvate ferredoxin oxidoreductase [Candidatus Woesearchaeota archaeon]HIH54983.1 pyruvate ferredoxin oxidoreductase [Candidatus Woesearchaeota archaeon]HIJ01640.1 pyruvate ferredoxin oxidoreductase [Candidatus Woesearchaeota archaeon]HIJ13367.1 pyruvate ferredoxin oxidoreductase [Candidatus Woesearchaeota archaeon]